ncbi:MAG: DUF5654 family protein [Nanoarchaeota archaeon]|nr:hypothetical protein [Nanoarchaeota archaeon]MBU4300181.1 hypothetical protein [Nanoarchaeota archaeon]MBU4452055.1 hypothetical protein [Nanoarchaeota archaeon]MCG2724436.1 DUF5654 family protein [archaeon]
MPKPEKKEIVDVPVNAVFGKAEKLRKEVRKNIGSAIVAAFAFIIALVWRDVITEAVDKLIIDFGLVGDTYNIRLIAAFLTTIICVVGILYFSKWSEKPVEKK